MIEMKIFYLSLTSTRTPHLYDKQFAEIRWFENCGIVGLGESAPDLERLIAYRATLRNHCKRQETLKS